MPNRSKDLMDIRELLLHLRATPSDRQVHRDTGMDRRTVKRYREWAVAQGLLGETLLPLEDLQALAARTLPVPPPRTSRPWNPTVT